MAAAPEDLTDCCETRLRASQVHTQLLKAEIYLCWPGKLFFMQIEYKRSGQLFHRLGVNSLPFIFRLSPSFPIEADGTVKLRSDDSMKHADYAGYPWTADDMATFVREKVILDTCWAGFGT